MTLTVIHNGLTYQDFEESALLQKGVPQATIDNALAADRLVKIKAECSRRIYAVLSAEAQANIASAAAVIGAIAEADRTTEQAAMLAAASDMVDWIADMRSAVQLIAADDSADYRDVSLWPECPATVSTLAESY